MPPAPARFSTITDWPHLAVSLLATVRAVMSVPPPGENGTMKVTGLAGKACASAPLAAANMATDAKSLSVFIGRMLKDANHDDCHPCASSLRTSSYEIRRVSLRAALLGIGFLPDKDRRALSARGRRRRARAPDGAEARRDPQAAGDHREQARRQRPHRRRLRRPVRRRRPHAAHELHRLAHREERPPVRAGDAGIGLALCFDSQLENKSFKRERADFI